MDQKDWDQFAADYAAVQRASRLPLAHDVTKWLLEENLLPTQSILDIGAGTGRYALPLADHTQRLTLVDWSEKMLAYAKRDLNLKDHGQITFLPIDWRHLGQNVLASLVFTSQIPDLSDDDLAIFAAHSTDLVVLNLQTAQTDQRLVQLAHQLALPVPKLPQADPSRAALVDRWLKRQQLTATKHNFFYQLTEETTWAQVVQDLAAPIGLQSLVRATMAINQMDNPNLPLKNTLTYTFTQWAWHIPQ